MKKLLLIVAGLLACAGVHAQDVTVINNTNCSVGFRLYAMDMTGGGTCQPDYTGPISAQAPMSTGTFGASTPYPSLPTAGTYAWYMVDGYDHTLLAIGSCNPVVNSTCHNSTGTPNCSFQGDGCYTVVTNCAGSGCPAGTVVNINWNDNGPVGGGTPIITFY